MEDLLPPNIVLNTLDVGVIVLYFLLLFLVSFAVSRGDRSVSGYFSADHQVNYLGVALSMFASNIGSEHFVGLAGTAAYSGFSIGWFELGAIPCLLLLAFVFLPVYFSAKVSTVPTYVELRYGKRTRLLMVALTLFIYVLSKISASLMACTILIEELFPTADPYFVTALHILASAAYTAFGGLKAVIYTESLQTLTLLAGGFVVLVYSLHQVGGFTGLVQFSHDMHRNESEVFNLQIFRSWDDPVQPWPAAVTGYYTFSLWYWAIDQNIVQRALAAKDMNHGTLACLLAALLKFLPFFLMVVPGVCGRMILENLVLDSSLLSPEELLDVHQVLFDTDKVYSFLLKTVVPLGFRGLVIAGLLSALMSSLASVFNSSSTLFVLNVYQDWRPTSSEERLIQVGRWAIVFMAVVSMLWLPVMARMTSHLYLIIQAPPACLTPPITAVVSCGMLFRTPNESGAEIALFVGTLLGLSRYGLDTLEQVNGETAGFRFGWFTSLHIMYFALVQFLLSALLLFVVSRCSRQNVVANPPSPPQLYWRRTIRQELSTSQHHLLRDSTGGEEDDTETTVVVCVLGTDNCPLVSLTPRRVEWCIRLLALTIVTLWIALLCSLQVMGK